MFDEPQGGSPVQDTSINDQPQGQDLVQGSDQQLGAESPSPISWESDPRHKDIWQNDPNKLYESYVNIERFQSKNQEKLKQLETELSEWKSKGDRVSQMESILSYIESDERLQKTITESLSAYEQERRWEKWGKDTPPHVIEQLEKAEQVSRELERIRAQQAEQEQVKLIDQQLGELEDYFKDVNLPFDRKKILTYAHENNIEPRYLSGEIMKAAQMHLRRSIHESAQRDVAKGIAMGSPGSLPTKGMAQASQPKAKTLQEKILEAFNK